MQAPKTGAARAQLLDPSASVWNSAPEEAMAMRGTPLGTVPGKYVKSVVSAEEVGAVRRLNVAALHNGTDLVFRLRWAVDRAVTEMAVDGSAFPDSCGIAFPLRGDAPIQEMGSPRQPVNAWQWRADLDEARAIIAEGLGTTARVVKARLVSAAAYENGEWRVCLGRPLQVPEAPDAAVTLTANGTVKVGFAVWAGYKRERGPVKSFSDHWRELQLEA